MGNGKPFYTDYVNHCLRLYCRYPTKCPDASTVGKRNWETVEKVLGEYPAQMREIIIYSYAHMANDVRTNVQEMSKITNIPTKEIWDAICEASHRIAEVRELI